MVDLELMMTRQAALQRAFGNPHPHDMTDAQRLQYIKDMAFALEDEVHEAMAETAWKPWVDGNAVNRDGYVSELIDALQFLMNLFAAVDCDAEEIANKLFAKHSVNWTRLTSKLAAKCPTCRRALDDTYVTCTADACAV